ncbi:MAG: hypothetical protein KatS3mg090_0539 [Patescibacteria group bacterium]|nr:MAG: hypothetical protein KatS3mg090_0539 [Patescibacteria group bacterium]
MFFILISLIKKEGVIIHASSIITQKGLILFLGKENSGKSTIVNLLNKNFEIFSDDILALKIKNNNVYGFQLPIVEKDNNIIKRNRSYKVQSIFLIRKKNQIKIRYINDKTIKLTKLIQQIWTTKNLLRYNLKVAKKIIDLIDNFYILEFPKKNDVVNDFFLKYTSKA